MNKQILLLCLLSVAFQVVRSEDKAAQKTTYKKKGEVLLLTDNNIANAIKEHESLVVKFHAPWCPHCKKLKPKFIKLAKEFKDDGIKFAMINADKHRKAGEDHQVGFES